MLADSDGLTNEVVRATFTKWAPWYDATHFMLPRRGRAIQGLDLRVGESVLDVACGTGLSFARLRRLVGSTGRVVGVDLTPAMLSVAERRIRRHGWENVEVQEADAASLPFEGGSFDKALCCYALSIIPSYRKAIEEAHRVLKPGGRLSVVDPYAREGGLGWRLAQRFPRIPHVCSVDLGHETADHLRKVFRSVQVRTSMGGPVMLAVCEK